MLRYRKKHLLVMTVLLCCGCRGERVWNNPYPDEMDHAKVMYAAFSERPKHLDPAKSYSENEYAFISQIYEPPLQYHYLKRPYTLIPATTVALPEVRYYDRVGRLVDQATEAEKTEYLIRIKPGIRYQPHPAFARDEQGAYRYHQLSEDDIDRIDRLADFEHTGSRELVAADYVFQIKRLADPAQHSPIAGIFANYIFGFHDFFKQVEQMRANQTDVDLREIPMLGVETMDRYTYRIVIKGVYPQFLYWMTMPFFAPMPWEAIAFYQQPGLLAKNISLDWYPVGTGPFMLVENNPNLRMTLKRNPYFREEYYPSEGMPGDRERGMLADAGQALPLLDQAVYQLENEHIPYWNKFIQGYYDSSGIASDNFDQAIQFADGEADLTEAMRARGMQLATATKSSLFYMGFNMRDEVIGGRSTANTKLRQAISIAIDYEEYIAIFLNGRGSVAHSILPPGIFGYRQGELGINTTVYNWQNGRPQRKSIETAKRLLSEAGYPDGIDPATGQPLVLYLDAIGAGPGAKANLQWTVKQYAKLGIRLVVRNTDYNRFQDKMFNGNIQIFQLGWNADYPDPENFFFLLYGPNGKLDHRGENASNYTNPEFDRLFEKMRVMPNGPERLQIIDRMNRILQQDAPWVFGFNPKSFALYHQWYQNVIPNGMINNTLKYRAIDPVSRQHWRQQWNRPIFWPVVALLMAIIAVLLPAYLSYRQFQHKRTVA